MKERKPKATTYVDLKADWGTREISGTLTEEDFDLIWDILSIIYRNEDYGDNKKAKKLLQQIVFDWDMDIDNHC